MQECFSNFWSDYITLPFGNDKSLLNQSIKFGSLYCAIIIDIINEKSFHKRFGFRCHRFSEMKNEISHSSAESHLLGFRKLSNTKLIPFLDKIRLSVAVNLVVKVSDP